MIWSLTYLVSDLMSSMIRYCNSQRCMSLSCRIWDDGTSWRDVREMTDFQGRSQRLRTLTTWMSGVSFLAGIVFHAVQFMPVDGAVDWITSETTVYTRVLYGLSILLGFLFIGPVAFRAILRGRADMNLLIFVAVVGALVLGEWFEASMVTFLFSSSVWLEQWSMKQVQSAMRGHLQQSPLIARCRKSGHGQTVELPIEQVDVGAWWKFGLVKLFRSTVEW